MGERVDPWELVQESLYVVRKLLEPGFIEAVETLHLIHDQQRIQAKVEVNMLSEKLWMSQQPCYRLQERLVLGFIIRCPAKFGTKLSDGLRSCGIEKNNAGGSGSGIAPARSIGLNDDVLVHKCACSSRAPSLPEFSNWCA